MEIGRGLSKEDLKNLIGLKHKITRGLKIENMVVMSVKLFEELERNF